MPSRQEALALQNRQSKILDRIERPFTREVLKAFNNYTRAVVQLNIRTGGVDNDILFSEFTQRLQNIFIKHGTKAIRVFVNMTFNDNKSFFIILENKQGDFVMQVRRQWINDFAVEKVVTIANNHREELRGVFAEINAQSLSTREAAKEIQKTFSLNKFKAERIARTETHNAAMFASKQTAEQIQVDTGLPVLKFWISSNDERVRTSHKQQDPTKGIPLEGKFQVNRVKGGFDLMDRPGDPTASAGNVIHCRCVLAQRVVI